MKKKLTTSYEELMNNRYGTADPDVLPHAAQYDELLANRFGESQSRTSRTTQKPAVVLSLSLDDGEILAQKQEKSQFEEYVVERHGLATQSSLAVPDTADGVSASQEYEVDVLDALKTPAAPQGTPPPTVEMPTRESIGQAGSAAAADLRGGLQAMSQSHVTDDDFIADMQSILTGQMAYDPARGKVVEREKVSPPQTVEPPNQGIQRPSNAPNEQAIFDRIAQSMAHANAYDLGTVELQNRFADFDRIFELQQQAETAKLANPAAVPAATAPAHPVVDSSDFIRDLDEIRNQRSAASAPAEPAVTSMAAAVDAVAAPAATKKLSGPEWVEQFPGSTETSELAPSFRANVERFISALNTAGAHVDIIATFRPLKRAYLMHFANKIARENFDPAIVPAFDPGLVPNADPYKGSLDIEWVHRDGSGNPDLKASRDAAEAMVARYHFSYPPAYPSDHAKRTAIDMNISWSGALAIRDGSGKIVTITSTPRTGADNADLIAVGATYNVLKLRRDPGHWSESGN